MSHSSFASTYIINLPDPTPATSMRVSTEDETTHRSHHVRQDTAESTSWLDTIDESGGSSSESFHSRTPSIGLRRQSLRATSGETEAALDAAFDAAVEAAYDEGFEPDDEDDGRPLGDVGTRFGEPEYMSDARRNVEIAKEMVREVEIEAARFLTRDREKWHMQERLAKRDSIDLDYQDDETDEEERMLEEMTRDYIMDDSEYDLQSKSALPRQSDSSGFSGRTWGSSIGSIPATAGTSLSTVAEAASVLTAPLQAKPLPPPSHPPPSGALPAPPVSSIATNSTPDASAQPPSGPFTMAAKAPPGVRDRRLSGTHATELKIETNTPPAITDKAAFRNALPQSAADLATAQLSLSLTDSEEALPRTDSLSDHARHQVARAELLPPAEVTSAEWAANIDPHIAVLPSGLTTASENVPPHSPGRFSTRTLGLRKNFSSSSLKNKTYSGVSNDSLDTSPGFPAVIQRRDPLNSVPSFPSANIVSDRPAIDGIHLFETDIHSPVTAGLPDPGATDPPLPLEPCPEMPLLRPFWLLRCIYQTIAHPRGGYISTRLFIPSSIWRVKNVKLRHVDEKVSACDLLSAALSKLAKVDTYDADAVLEEMQFLENVMEQAQSNLSKKLGNDVGLPGTSSLFKASGVTEEGTAHTETQSLKSSNTHSKSYLSSWRKLRSKTSGAGLVPNPSGTSMRDISKDGATLESLPMTSMPEPKFPTRDLGRIQYGGPNANYMAALARLCDAAQVLGKSSTGSDARRCDIFANRGPRQTRLLDRSRILA